MQVGTRYLRILAAVVHILCLAGCAAAGGGTLPEETLAVRAQLTPLAASTESCRGSFVEHVLDHTTTVPGGDQVRNFEANGSGVAINDLDNDGDLDIVLGNHAGRNTILWNEGRLNFTSERMDVGDTRTVNIVDFDADGWLDILLTRTGSAPNFWRNDGAAHPSGRGFEQVPLSTLVRPLYATTWGDLDGDGDLDLVGATYDAALLDEFGVDFLMSGHAGAYYYENDGGDFAETRLSSGAQALVIILFDLDEDGDLDIMVGNDFAVFDQAWIQKEGRWSEWPSLETTTHSTMSFDLGDVDNDGQYELFATDMKPYSDDGGTVAAWQPVLRALLSDTRPEGDPQVSENMFQVRSKDGAFHNQAPARGLDATGWSWSSKFGDLNQDGFLDLYVVNGMIELTTLGHLPNHELVEENQALKNDGMGNFEPMPEWGLNATESGRGMSMADLDGDGDLDIVVNNLRTPARLFENQLCEGSSLQVDLSWPGSGNTRALGSTLVLHLKKESQFRQVRASSGYLSGDPARVHFGLPDGDHPDWLEIRWPDGEISVVGDLEAGSHVVLTRD
jgi:uncharacterized protein YuzB (UPF0349 family)